MSYSRLPVCLSSLVPCISWSSSSRRQERTPLLSHGELTHLLLMTRGRLPLLGMKRAVRPKKVASIGEGKQASLITGARQAEDLYARHTPPPLHLDHGFSSTTVKHSKCRPKPPAESLPTLQKSPRPRPRQRPPPSSTPSHQPPHHRHKLHHRRRGHSPPRQNRPRLLVRSDHSSLTLRARPSQRAQPSMRHPSGPRRPIRPQRLAVSRAAGLGAGDAAI